MGDPPKEDDAKELLKLAVKAVAGEANSDRNLAEFVDQPQCTSRLIARARIRATHLGYGIQGDMVRKVLSDLLHIKLTDEHVAAQEQMSDAAEGLQKAALKVSQASWGIGVASLIVTAAALYVAVVK